MRGKPFCGAYLIVPAEATSRVLGELDIVRGIGVDEITSIQRKVLDIALSKRSNGRAPTDTPEKSRRYEMWVYRPNGTLKSPERLKRHNPL